MTPNVVLRCGNQPRIAEVGMVENRLVTAIDYKRQIIFIKWIGTHAAYDKIVAKTVRYESQAD